MENSTIETFGGPTVDPTANVRELNAASARRADDLAAAQKELFKEIADSIRREMELRAEHQALIRILDADRLEKIRMVDQANAAATAAQLLSAVQTLAATASATAETLRNQVAATAAAVAGQTERVVGPIIERLSVLEKSQAVGQGRATVADPALEQMVVELRKLTQAQASSTGKSEGISATAKAIIAAVSLLATILGIITVLGGAYIALRPKETAPPAVSYVPVPSNVQSTTQPKGAAPP